MKKFILKLVGAFCVVFFLVAAYLFFYGESVVVESDTMGDTLKVGNAVYIFEVDELERDNIIRVKINDDEYFSRVIALPGDTIKITDHIIVNGKQGPPISSNTILKPQLEYYNNVVPEGYYLVLGDNRNTVDDSGRFGLILKEQITGKTS